MSDPSWLMRMFTGLIISWIEDIRITKMNNAQVQQVIKNSVTLMRWAHAKTIFEDICLTFCITVL